MDNEVAAWIKAVRKQADIQAKASFRQKKSLSKQFHLDEPSDSGADPTLLMNARHEEVELKRQQRLLRQQEIVDENTDLSAKKHSISTDRAMQRLRLEQELQSLHKKIHLAPLSQKSRHRQSHHQQQQQQQQQQHAQLLAAQQADSDDDDGVFIPAASSFDCAHSDSRQLVAPPAHDSAIFALYGSPLTATAARQADASPAHASFVRSLFPMSPRDVLLSTPRATYSALGATDTQTPRAPQSLVKRVTAFRARCGAAALARAFAAWRQQASDTRTACNELRAYLHDAVKRRVLRAWHALRVRVEHDRREAAVAARMEQARRWHAMYAARLCLQRWFIWATERRELRMMGAEFRARKQMRHLSRILFAWHELRVRVTVDREEVQRVQREAQIEARMNRARSYHRARVLTRSLARWREWTNDRKEAKRLKEAARIVPMRVVVRAADGVEITSPAATVTTPASAATPATQPASVATAATRYTPTPRGGTMPAQRQTPTPASAEQRKTVTVPVQRREPALVKAMQERAAARLRARQQLQEQYEQAKAKKEAEKQAALAEKRLAEERARQEMIEAAKQKQEAEARRQQELAAERERLQHLIQLAVQHYRRRLLRVRGFAPFVRLLINAKRREAAADAFSARRLLSRACGAFRQAIRFVQRKHKARLIERAQPVVNRCAVRSLQLAWTAWLAALDTRRSQQHAALQHSDHLVRRRFWRLWLHALQRRQQRLQAAALLLQPVARQVRLRLAWQQWLWFMKWQRTEQEREQRVGLLKQRAFALLRTIQDNPQ